LRIFLLDDDPIFCRLMERVAKKQHLELTHCSSLAELGSRQGHRDFDVAIVDYYLENLTGTDIACLFQDKPVILISQTDQWMNSDTVWPDCIREFIPKSAGVEAILIAAVCLAQRAA
jgi:DNA-binding response OmpR family regulator